ncbi:MAG: hypothetical protein J0L92_30295 [Deltaproteobacteria bacterium]|nr:hypothetical protein [Deltaproteobacteria bacterium]
MANRIWNAVSLVVALSALPLFASEVHAQDAQCRPGDLLCGEVQLGPIQGQIRIGPGDAAPPPPVYVQPVPPPVVVQPPPPVYVQPPPPVVQPPVVYVQQPPPPVVVQPPQPQVITVQRRRVVYDLVPAFDMGLHLHIGGLFSDRVAMGGGMAAFRIRPIEFLAIDLGMGIYGGQDYQGADRWEVPVVADILVFFNPGDRFQVYGLVGGGVSFGQQGSYSGGPRGDFFASRDLAYVGGEAGLGLEWRIGRHFALNLDARAFLREQVGGGVEFTEIQDGVTRTTNTSTGVVGNLGMTFYFVGL